MALTRLHGAVILAVVALAYLALAFVSVLGPSARAASFPARDMRLSLPRSLIQDLPQGVPAPSIEDQDAAPPVRRVAEVYELVEVDNDNDGKRTRLSARADASGRLTQLESLGITDPSERKIFAMGPAWTRCNGRGSDRIDRRYACGIEMEHARGDISAIRLYSPDLDPSSGGTIHMIYLKHYAIFGSHEVAVLTLKIRKEGDSWGLFVAAGGSEQRIHGLFIHRASRGIGSITACLQNACPASWSRRGRDQNDGLPPVYDPASYWAPHRSARR